MVKRRRVPFNTARMDPDARPTDAPDVVSPPPTTSPPLAEIAAVFTRLGFTAFGGPAAHVAMMEDELVHRRKWLDRQHFLDLVASLNFIPGPNSTELAIHLGLIRGGMRGLVVAGFCFITPAVLIILPIAWLYVRYAGAGVQPPPAVLGALQGVAAVVVAILAVAAVRLVPAAVKSPFTIAIAVLTLPAEYFLRRYTNLQSEIVILATAAVAGAVLSRWTVRPPPSTALAVLPLTPFGGPHGVLAGLARSISATATPLLATFPATTEFLRLAWYFLTVGGTLFGSGYVLVNYLETGLVTQLQWLTQRQVADAIAVGQVTPGPLLTTATFAGFLRGHAITGSDWGGVVGGIVATVAIFLPAFVLVALFGRVLPILRSRPWARGALDAMNAAVVMLLAVVTVRFAVAAIAPAGRVDWLAVALCAASLPLMIRFGVNSAILIAVGALAGYAAAS